MFGPPPERCVIRRIVGSLSTKWGVLIVIALAHAPKRFGDLRKGFPDMPPTSLSNTLKRLVRDGLAERTVSHDHPPQVHYALTGNGKSLAQHFQGLMDWGLSVEHDVLDARDRHDGQSKEEKTC